MNGPMIRIYGNADVANRAMDSMRGSRPLTVSIPGLGLTLEAVVFKVSGPPHVGTVWEIELRQLRSRISSSPVGVDT